jgi:hypothetical protein
MAMETRNQPSAYSLIGVIQGRGEPVKGIFKKGDEPIAFFTMGDMPTQNWKLVSLSSEEAKFQNTVFGELTYTLKIQVASGQQTSGQRQVTNYF